MARKIKTIEDIKAAVAEIRETKKDCEHAHITEDALYVNTLRAIANGVDNPVEMATEALKATKIKYLRWYG